MKGAYPLATTIRIHPAAPPKPRWGDPCNGCGVCCLARPCPLGMLLSGRRNGSCAALRWDDPRKRYVCGAISQPHQVLPRGWRWFSPWLGAWAQRWISAGSGCDARIDFVDETA